MIESKPDHFLDDLRLNNPWPELRRYRFSLSIVMFFYGLFLLLSSFCILIIIIIIIGVY